jgi:hypothetical protein
MMIRPMITIGKAGHDITGFGARQSAMTQISRPPGQNFAASELGAALAGCRRAFLAVALFSGMSNLLM